VVSDATKESEVSPSAEEDAESDTSSEPRYDLTSAAPQMKVDTNKVLSFHSAFCMH